MFVEQLRGNYDSLFDVARRLAKEGGKEEQTYFLQSLMTRSTNSQSSPRRSGNEPPKAEPLSDEDVDLMLACYENLSRQKDDDNGRRPASSRGAQLAYGSNGQVYVNIGGQYGADLRRRISGGSAFLGQVLKELELVGRDEKAEELVEKQIAEAESAGELSGVIQLLVSREEEHPQPERIRELYDRWAVAAKDEIDDPPQAAARRGHNQTSVNDPLAANSQMMIGWFGKLGPEEEHEQMLAILNPALDLAVEVGKARRAERSTEASAVKHGFATIWPMGHAVAVRQELSVCPRRLSAAERLCDAAAIDAASRGVRNLQPQRRGRRLDGLVAQTRRAGRR